MSHSFGLFCNQIKSKLTAMWLNVLFRTHALILPLSWNERNHAESRLGLPTTLSEVSCCKALRSWMHRTWAANLFSADVLCQNAENRDMFPCNDFPDKSKTLSDRTYQVIQTIYIYTYLCNMYNYITVYIVNVLISMYTLTHMYIYIYRHFPDCIYPHHPLTEKLGLGR